MTVSMLMDKLIKALKCSPFMVLNKVKHMPLKVKVVDVAGELQSKNVSDVKVVDGTIHIIVG